jgi:uncharacterized protein YceH (UPF0502 family)
MELSPIQVRVLGSLMEKARTTPENYPLTLNALVHACNQKTSRDPVTEYDEDEILDVLDQLRELGLVIRVDLAGSRTAKFRENLSTRWSLPTEEYALLATLFLRGAQTPGQLRQRSDRLFPFAELQHVNDCLKQLQAREEEPFCLVRTLPRTIGTKEIRYEHTLLPEKTEDSFPAEPEATIPDGDIQPGEAPSTPLEQRLKDIESRLNHLEKFLHELTE